MLNIYIHQLTQGDKENWNNLVVKIKELPVNIQYIFLNKLLGVVQIWCIQRRTQIINMAKHIKYK